MATCPQCGTTLKDDYGMSQCPSCGGFSFIDMGGVAVIAASEVSVIHDEQIRVEPGGAAAPSEFSDPIEGLISDNTNDSLDHFAQISAIDIPSSPENSASAEYAGTEFQSFDIGHMNEVADRADDPEPVVRAPRQEADFGPASDPLNLNDFANSEVSSAKDGPLLFRVLISGIDAKEIRESIREVLEDSRFGWDSKEIFSKISRGHLVIGALSPVKASILITRIKRLPVTIRWEQYAITQGPDSETDF